MLVRDPAHQSAMHVTGAISPPQAREEEEKAVEQIRDMGGSNYDTMISGRAYGVWRSPANQPTSHACDRGHLAPASERGGGEGGEVNA